MPKLGSSFRRYGPTALVTGAASGIGRAFAERLGREGFSLVLADRDAAGLESVAATLRRPGPASVRAMTLDLTSATDVAQLTRLAETEDVGLVVHSAGIHRLGRFLDIPLEIQLASVDLHCRTTLSLAYAFAKPMVAKKRGGIILFSSNSALLRTPLVSNYAATKAYTITLAETLWEELRHEGVDVLGLVPGMTDTPGLRDQHPTADSKRFTQTPESVVDGALAKIGHGPVHITTLSDTIAAALFGRLLPRAWSLPLARKSMVHFFPHLDDPSK